MPTQAKGCRSLFDSSIARRASIDAIVKLAPRTMMKNPVMLVVEVGSALTSVLLILDTIGTSATSVSIGEPRINVLELNLALDTLTAQ